MTTASNSSNAALDRDVSGRAISAQSPVTSLSTELVVSLHKRINRDIHSLGEAYAERLQKPVQKLTHATQLSFAEQALL